MRLHAQCFSFGRNSFYRSCVYLLTGCLFAILVGCGSGSTGSSTNPTPALREVWVPTKVPCKPVTSNKWHHLMWQFDKVNNKVHYISVTLDGTTTPVDITFGPQPNWNLEDIDIAFQMDGDSKQTPYNVWLDNVTLTASY